MEENRFKQDAKTIIDLTFESKCFREDITRDQMNATEDYIADMMQTRFDSHLKCQELLKSIEKNKDK